MYKNRHFVFMLSCLVCMGVLLWSQSHFLSSDGEERGWNFADLGDWGQAITAMAQGEPMETQVQPEGVVRSFWRQLDLRQIDSAKALVTQDMVVRADVQELFTLFAENPLLSIQNTTVVATDVSGRYLVNMRWNSVISDREDVVYFCDVQNREGKWVISNLIRP
ncbi:MAG: hypothetical protein FWG14_03845 [Peptococcaceae bacterium]|nr:hypothetical protein [Peptococcaceae bacterium]